MPQWRVRDVMTTEVVTARDDASYAEIAAILTGERISGVPIEESSPGASDPPTRRTPMLAELP